MKFHTTNTLTFFNKNERIHPKSNELLSAGSTSPVYHPNTTTDSCHHGDNGSRSRSPSPHPTSPCPPSPYPTSWCPTNSLVQHANCGSFQHNVSPNRSSPLSSDCASMYGGDAEVLVGAAKANMTVDLDMEVESHRTINLDSDDEDMTLENVAKKKRKRSNLAKAGQKPKHRRRLTIIPQNFEDKEGEDHGLTIARYVLGEAKTYGWDKLQNASDRRKWVKNMLPLWKRSFLLKYNPLGHAVFDKYLAGFRIQVKNKYWGIKHSSDSDENGEELHKAISLCLEWIENTESTDALNTTAEKKKIDAFLDSTLDELGICSESMKQEDSSFGQLIDLLKNEPEQQKQEKVVICLMRAGSDKKLEMVFQKSSDRKMEHIIQEASMHQCDFFNFTTLEHEAVRSKTGTMILNVDGMSDFSYGLFKSFGLIELVGISKGEKNNEGHTVINITSRIEMKGQDVSHLLA